MAKDLRSAHFYMGEDKVGYTSEAADHFKEGYTITKAPDMSYLYKGSINFK